MQFKRPISIFIETGPVLRQSDLRARVPLHRRGIATRKPTKEDMARFYIYGADNSTYFTACALRTAGIPVTILTDHNLIVQNYLEDDSRLQVKSEDGRLLMDFNDVQMEAVSRDRVSSLEDLDRAAGAKHYRFGTLATTQSKDTVDSGVQVSLLPSMIWETHAYDFSRMPMGQVAHTPSKH